MRCCSVPQRRQQRRSVALPGDFGGVRSPQSPSKNRLELFWRARTALWSRRLGRVRPAWGSYEAAVEPRLQRADGRKADGRIFDEMSIRPPGTTKFSLQTNGLGTYSALSNGSSHGLGLFYLPRCGLACEAGCILNSNPPLQVPIYPRHAHP